MKVALLLAPGNLRRWHVDLADRLIADGHAVALRFDAQAPVLPYAVGFLEQFEAILTRRGASGPSDRIDDARADDLRPTGFETEADVTIDLSGAAEIAAGVTLAILFDGAPGDAALTAALLERRLPVVSIVAVGADALAIFEEGRPALERPDVFLVGRDAVCGRLPGLVRRTIERIGQGAAPARTVVRAGGALAGTHPARFMFESIAAAASRKLKRLLVHDDHWRIGIRRLASPADGVLDRLAWPANGYHWLADDRRRYYADPFLFRDGGTTWLFCEEYPYATRKGILSVARVDADGIPETPRPILETETHLSYPFVFRHAGAIYMMPESSGAKTLELWRAIAFPDRWERVATLVSGVSLADATLFAHAGRFWITAAIQEPSTSSWDALMVYVADDPLGPWRPASSEPLLIDASSVRPAGHVVERDGVLYRPAQDCRDGYGAALTLARIDAIGEGRFEQTIVKRLDPPPGGPPWGVHTLNALDDLEVIDATGPMPRYGALGTVGAGAGGIAAASGLALTLL
ncbi:hypothetical protein [Methyloraptor flagellatus]|uniref:Glucosamine inositolphosphorylceramide transferase 1 N-terminal domain-containing protein n=1 Tax=Methyloraptor flagellatus TaxID=3162530 RepID=A0AAU7X8Y0_9HYPH